MRAVIADDHPMCREAAKAALLAAAPSAEVVMVSSANQLAASVEKADLIVLDLGLPDSRGIVSLIDVFRGAPDAAILVVSGSEQPGIEAQVAAHGAAGFVAKAAPLTELIAAIRDVLAGGRWFSPGCESAAPANDFAARLIELTAAERRVLNAMRGGDLNKQIAYDLSLSEVTIKQHVKAILRKLGVLNRTQAILTLRAVEDGQSSLV